MNYAELKIFIEEYTGLTRDALHIHAALLLYIIAMGIFRQSRRSRVPWLVVLAIIVGNEAYDLDRNWPDGPDYAISSAVKDLWNTMLWPTVLLILGRYTTWFKRKRPVEEDLPRPPEEPPASGTR